MDLAIAECAGQALDVSLTDEDRPTTDLANAACGSDMPDPGTAERRTEGRLPGAAAGVLHASVRPGCPVHVVDLSWAGAQVESDRPLRPGSRVHVRMVSEEWTLAVAARVLRCVVWTLDAEAGVIYRGALRFEERCPVTRGL